VSTFVPHAFQVGFFVNFSRFLDAIFLPEVSNRRVSPCLVDAVLLWGAHLSINRSVASKEPVLLARAVQSVADAVPQIASLQHNPVHVIQAEILLSNYFFCQSRPLEGTYHCSAAVAHTLSCGLHRRGGPMRSPGLSGAGIVNLLPPLDEIETDERVNAFWAVFTLDRTWSVAQGVPGNDAFSNIQISTPWPGEANATEGGASGNSPTIDTVQAFFANPTIPHASNTVSTIAVRAKAAAILERAGRLAAQWSPGMTDTQGYYSQVSYLDRLAQQFSASLPPLDSPDVVSCPEVLASLLLTHTYTRVASIRLHSHIQGGRGDLAAAVSAMDILGKVKFDTIPFMDPIFGMLWKVVAHVFMSALGNIRQDNYPERQAFNMALSNILRVMQKFAPTSASIAAQTVQLQQDMMSRGLNM